MRAGAESDGGQGKEVRLRKGGGVGLKAREGRGIVGLRANGGRGRSWSGDEADGVVAAVEGMGWR
jgi:hypothetical protein